MIWTSKFKYEITRIEYKQFIYNLKTHGVTWRRCCHSNVLDNEILMLHLHVVYDNSRYCISSTCLNLNRHIGYCSFKHDHLEINLLYIHFAKMIGHRNINFNYNSISLYPYSQALTLTPYSHVSFSSSYFWSRHPVITLHLIPLSYTYQDYHPSPLSPHITQHNISQLTHHHINTMTTSHSPADDGRKNSSESSCYAYIYCYFYVFTQLYKSLKYSLYWFFIIEIKLNYRESIELWRYLCYWGQSFSISL